MKLVDSSVAIDYLRNHQPAVELVRRLTRERTWLAASELVRFEVLAGARPPEEPAVKSFFRVLAWIPVDETVARRAAALARRFRRAHSGIEDGDYIIAATALELEADLLTTNVRHFPMLPGLPPAY